MQSAADIQMPLTRSIDDEHREIILLIHEFDELLCQGGPAEQIVDLFAVVHSNIKPRFEIEERLMRDCRYPDNRAHKNEHDRLLQELGEIMADYERRGYPGQDLALARRITDWFTVQFSRMDAPMISFEHHSHGSH